MRGTCRAFRVLADSFVLRGTIYLSDPYAATKLRAVCTRYSHMHSLKINGDISASPEKATEDVAAVLLELVRSNARNDAMRDLRIYFAPGRKDLEPLVVYGPPIPAPPNNVMSTIGQLFPSLRTLHLRNIDETIPPAVMEALWQGFPQLSSLAITGHSLPSCSIQVLASFSSLTSLSLCQDNALSGERWSLEDFTALAGGLTALTTLEFVSRPDHPLYFRPEQLKLVAGLRAFPRLTHLQVGIVVDTLPAEAQATRLHELINMLPEGLLSLSLLVRGPKWGDAEYSLLRRLTHLTELQLNASFPEERAQLGPLGPEALPLPHVAGPDVQPIQALVLPLDEMVPAEPDQPDQPTVPLLTTVRKLVLQVAPGHGSKPLDAPYLARLLHRLPQLQQYGDEILEFTVASSTFGRNSHKSVALVQQLVEQLARCQRLPPQLHIHADSTIPLWAHVAHLLLQPLFTRLPVLCQGLRHLEISNMCLEPQLLGVITNPNLSALAAVLLDQCRLPICAYEFLLSLQTLPAVTQLFVYMCRLQTFETLHVSGVCCKAAGTEVWEKRKLFQMRNGETDGPLGLRDVYAHCALQDQPDQDVWQGDAYEDYEEILWLNSDDESDGFGGEFD